MSKYDLMNNLIEENNGYIFTEQVEKAGISRAYLGQFVRENSLERVAKGVYISQDTWEDELYVLQLCYPKIIFSGETALYLHVLIDREYSKIHVTVPPKYNQTRLREKGVIVHQEKLDTYELGVENVKTNFGNTVRAYNKERCICDAIKNREKLEIQMFQTAIKDYFRGKDKDLHQLMCYAEQLKIRDEVMKYVEVMI